jgi:hypothetical protein
MQEFRVRFSDEQEVQVEVSDSANFEDVAVQVNLVTGLAVLKTPALTRASCHLPHPLASGSSSSSSSTRRCCSCWSVTINRQQ